MGEGGEGFLRQINLSLLVCIYLYCCTYKAVRSVICLKCNSEYNNEERRRREKAVGKGDTNSEIICQSSDVFCTFTLSIWLTCSVKKETKSCCCCSADCMQDYKNERAGI
jgi:hypothetical protein